MLPVLQQQFSECSHFDDCMLDSYGGELEYSKAELAAMKFDDDDEESTSEDLDSSRSCQECSIMPSNLNVVAKPCPF